MEVRKAYKQTEVGVIPEDWDLTQLGKIGSFKKGKGIKKDAVVSDGFPCVRYGELYTTHNEYIKEFKSFVSIDTAKESQRINKGDLLFAGSGETKEEIGKCAAFIGGEEAYAGGDVIILSPKEMDSLYLGFLLNHELVQKQKAQRAQGDAIVHIYPNNLSDISIPLPPTKAEQTAIASALSDADALIQSLEKLIAKKRSIKQGAMQELLKPKDGWVEKKLGEIADPNQKWSFTGGPFGSNLKSSDYTDEGIRIIQLQNIGDGEFINNYQIYTSETKANELLSCNIYPGDIILSKMGDPVARACIIPGLHHRYLMCSDGIRLAVDKKRYNTYFIYAYINAPSFRALAENASTGSTRKRIGLSELRNLEVCLPDIIEQTRIATILSDMDAEISVLETKLAKYKQIKQGMMQELLTGKTRLV